MLTMASFLADMVMPSAKLNSSRAISRSGARLVARLAKLDEVAVLRKPGSVDEERYPMGSIDRRNGFDILHRDRLAPAGIVRNGHHPNWECWPRPPAR